MSEETEYTREFKLEPDSELRFEVKNSKFDKVTLELKNGMAEIFGAELTKGKKYEFGTGARAAVFSYQGCIVELCGKVEMSFVSRETPMGLYLNTHAALERIRESAEKEDGLGPILMIVGPCDVGKSTLCTLLLNYAVRMGRKPLFVDLDVGQGQIAIPGTIGAIVVERPSDIIEGFSQKAPLVFHYGENTPSNNVILYNVLVSRLAEVCSERLQTNKKAKASGMIINTCGWVTNGGYKLLTHAVQAFEADAIIVLEHERLYNELLKDIPKFVKVVFLPKSGGVAERSSKQRSSSRDTRVRDYFYGSRISMHPHSLEVRWSDAKIYKIGDPGPISFSSGSKLEKHHTKLVAVKPGRNLLRHVLSVSLADPSVDDVVHTNVAGFVCVTAVDLEKKTFTVLSPQPQLQRNVVLLYSEIQFFDSR